MLRILHEECCGHIGILRLVFFQLMYDYTPRHKDCPTLSTVLRHYYGGMLHSYPRERFFPWRPSVLPSPDSGQFAVMHSLVRRVALDELVPLPDSEDVSEQAVVLRKLLGMPVFAAEGARVVFATALHRRFYLRKLYPSALQRAQDFKSDLDEWLLQVISTFEPARLMDRSLAGADIFAKERLVRHMFWHGACLCLLPKHGMSELAHNNANKLDFWINGDLQWAIELMRAGDRNFNRFEDVGIL